MNLVETGQVYPKQIRVVDMRFAKVIRFGRTRTDIGVDLYNLFNTNVATTYNQTFGVNAAGDNTWLRPTAVYLPRFVRFAATVNF